MTTLPALISDERSELASADNAGAYMEAMLDRAVMWLGEVEKIEDVIHQKCATEAIATFIREKELGRSAELAAAEIIRRCERRIAQLIRVGQEAGEIRKRGDNTKDPVLQENLVSPSAYIRGSKEIVDAYAMTDGVTEKKFDEVIAEAKAEGNLSRANVVRKVKGTPAPKSERSEWQRGTRRIDPNRIMAQTAIALDALVSTIPMVDIPALDPDVIAQWAGPMKQSLLALNRFLKEITNAHQD